LVVPTVQRAFDEKGDIKKILDNAEVEIFALAQQQTHRDFIELKEFLVQVSNGWRIS
jgi:replicative DNA helicase